MIFSVAVFLIVSKNTIRLKIIGLVDHINELCSKFNLSDYNNNRISQMNWKMTVLNSSYFNNLFKNQSKKTEELICNKTSFCRDMYFNIICLWNMLEFCFLIDAEFFRANKISRECIMILYVDYGTETQEHLFRECICTTRDMYDYIVSGTTERHLDICWTRKRKNCSWTFTRMYKYTPLVTFIRHVYFVVMYTW